MPPRSPPDSIAAGVLRDSWGITVEPERARPGASRNVWRVDGSFWLSHSDSTEEASFRRETQLLETLTVTLAERGAPWFVPGVVRTVNDQTVAVTRDGVWRLAQHLPGEQPDMREPDTYPALARRLAELHAVLDALPHSLAVRERGAVERTQALMDAHGQSSFHPVTDDPREQLALETAVRWLGPRIEQLASAPRQLTHGDWIPPNIKLRADGWGVLDWEFSRVDPVEIDLAQSCSTILLWSGLPDPAAHISSLVATYRTHSGREVSIENVRTAMAAYWLQNYSHWRERYETDDEFRSVLAHQPELLLAVAQFLGAG